MPRRRPRTRIPLLVGICSVACAVLAYIFGMAAAQAATEPLFTPGSLIIPRTVDVIVAAWCIWVGSSIGSFLNVVAWRMPRGESINGWSHCPRCNSKLQARDNFPVFGWLALGGRCRTCRLPISIRYPIVEGVVGLTITLLAIGELYSLSLPRQEVPPSSGVIWEPLVNRVVLLTLLYHVVALSTSWAFGLIRMDGNRLPIRLLCFGYAAVIIPLLIYPTLMVVPWQMQVGYGWDPSGLYVDAMVRVIAALAAATVLARYLARGLCPLADPKLDPLGRSTVRLLDLVAVIAIPTVVVGWQAAPAVVALASLIGWGLRRYLPSTCDALGSFAIAMPLALTFQLVFWRQLHAGSGVGSGSMWPSDGGSPWVVLTWLGIVMLVPLWLKESEGEAEVTRDDGESAGDDPLDEPEATDVDDDDRAEDETNSAT